MNDILQWAGMLAVYVRRPRLAAIITICGCLSILTWALALSPTAWGVVALEVAVIAISLRNLRIAA